MKCLGFLRLDVIFKDLFSSDGKFCIPEYPFKVSSKEYHKAFFNQAIRTPHNPVVKQAFGQLPKLFFSQSRKFLISRGLVLGGIKWNRSS